MHAPELEMHDRAVDFGKVGKRTVGMFPEVEKIAYDRKRRRPRRKLGQ